MDSYAENEVKVQPTEKSYYMAELVKVECELAKNIRIIMDQQTQLAQANDKIFMQDKQLEEAAEILRLQQKLLNASEQERKLTDKKLQESEAEKQAIAEKCRVLETALRYTKSELHGLLNLVSTKTNMAEKYYEYSNGSNMTPLMRIRAAAKALEIKLTERMEHQRRMKCEIGVLRKTIEELQKTLAISKKPRFIDYPKRMENKTRTKDKCVFKLDENNNTQRDRIVVKLKLRKEQLAHIQPHEKKWLPCNRCGKNFLGKWALTQHDRKEHGFLSRRKTTRFACTECGFTYFVMESLLEHQRNCYKNKVAIIKRESMIKIDLDQNNSSDDEYEFEDKILLGRCIYLKPHI